VIKRQLTHLEDDSGEELSFSFARFAGRFDQHIRQSIRGYADLLSDCVSLSEYFVDNDTIALDIGCSTGTFLRTIGQKNHHRCPTAMYIGIDIEESFQEFWQEVADERMHLEVANIVTYEIPPRCSFVTSIFSLQFVIQSERQRIISQICSSLVTGGALIVAEKTLSPMPKLNDMLTSIHYDFKRLSFTEAEILAKERSLRPLMKLWSEEQIINSLVAAGFTANHVQCFWRNHNFAAFIAVK
jgi:tRNA (cmo5U34)-methyltransferase